MAQGKRRGWTSRQTRERVSSQLAWLCSLLPLPSAAHLLELGQLVGEGAGQPTLQLLVPLSSLDAIHPQRNRKEAFLWELHPMLGLQPNVLVLSSVCVPLLCVCVGGGGRWAQEWSQSSLVKG